MGEHLATLVPWAIVVRLVPMEELGKMPEMGSMVFADLRVHLGTTDTMALLG